MNSNTTTTSRLPSSPATNPHPSGSDIQNHATVNDSPFQNDSTHDSITNAHNASRNPLNQSTHTTHPSTTTSHSTAAHPLASHTNHHGTGTHNFSHSDPKEGESVKVNVMDIVNLGYPREHKNHHYIIGKKHASSEYATTSTGGRDNGKEVEHREDVEGRHGEQHHQGDVVHQHHQNQSVVDNNGMEGNGFDRHVVHGHQHTNAERLNNAGMPADVGNEVDDGYVAGGHEGLHHQPHQTHQANASVVGGNGLGGHIEHQHRSHQNTVVDGGNGLHRRAEELNGEGRVHEEGGIGGEHRNAGPSAGEKKLTPEQVINIGYPHEHHQRYQHGSGETHNKEVRK